MTEPSQGQPIRRLPVRMLAATAQLAELATGLSGLATLGACGAASAWPLELLSHFRAQYAVTLLVLCGLLAAAKRFRWAGVAAAAVALNMWHVWPYVPLRGAVTRPEPAADLPHWRLLSINVYSGNPTPERVIDFIRATDPDTIAVLEVTPEWERRLQAIEAAYPHQAVQSRAGNFGIALYSKLPLEDVQFVTLSENNHAISARIAMSGAGVRLIAAHPFPPVGSAGAGLRNRQLQQLARHAARFDGPRIVAGDLNITPFSPYFHSLLTDAGLRDPRRGQGLLATWPSQNRLLRIPIDHCLVSDEITARLEIGPDLGSDHRPLLAQCALRQQPEQ